VANGAAAISVIADERYFGGGAHIVEDVVMQVAGAVPVLYKDFVLDPWQVAEARAVGADAVMTTARALDIIQLHEILATAAELGMDCVVEIFTERDIALAMIAGARIISINTCDPPTLEIDLDRSTRLRATLPPGTLAISESGLNRGDDTRHARAAGFDAVLVGEAIVTAADIGAKVRELASAGSFHAMPSRS
jgi:indole-3-glycerol phosphate synthase